MDLFVIIAALALAVAATTAVWRAWQEAAAREAEARLRAAAEERARQEAEAREAEARLRAEAEERARREAADRERAQARARKEIEAREAEAQARKEAEARARAAERRAAKAGAEVAEARVDVAKRVDERTLVNALTRALPALAPERARRLEHQLEALARNRADAEQIKKGIEATSDEEVRAQLLRKLRKIEGDAAALVERLRNVLQNDPDLQAVRLSLAWGTRVSTSSKSKTDKKTE